MNPWKQYWTLLRFQPSINPFILIMPIALAAPLYIPLITGRISFYHPDLDILLANQNLFFVGFIGVMWLAPEIFQFGAAKTAYSNGTEFLLTCAVDRRLLYRARATFYYLLILSIPLITLLAAFRHPEIRISEYKEAAHRLTLANFPDGQLLVPEDRRAIPDVILPNGNLWIQAWRLWIFLCCAVLTQIFLFLVSPLKYRRYFVWIVYSGFILLPFWGLSHISANANKLSWNESLFFGFVAHGLSLCLLTGCAIVLAQLWCERRFARQEQ